MLAAVMAAGTALAQSQEGRLSGLQLSGDQPIQIESDRLEVRDGENIAIFSGNVAVSQGDTVMRAGTMTVHYSGNAAPGGAGSADIERLEVSGGVHVRSRDQVATGDRGTFDMRAEVLVMTGDEVDLYKIPIPMSSIYDGGPMITAGVVIGMIVVLFYATLGGMNGITYTQVAQYCVLIFAYLVPAIAIAFLLTGNPVPQLAIENVLPRLDGLTEELGLTGYSSPFTHCILC
jgi:lipopolysaccharide export system protein LptA